MYQNDTRPVESIRSSMTKNLQGNGVIKLWDDIMAKMKLKDAVELVDSFDGLKKETYSFRCNPVVLAKLSDYAKINHITLPKLINTILYDFVSKYTEDFECERFDINYLELPLVEKAMYIDNELKSTQKQINDLSKMFLNLKNEMNREFLKKRDIE